MLVLGREHDVHADERQGHRPAEVGDRAFQLAGAADDAGGVAGGQAKVAGGLVDGGDTVGQGVAGGEVGADRGHALAVEAVDARRRVGFFEADDVVQPRQRRRPGGEAETRNQRGGVAALGIRVSQARDGLAQGGRGAHVELRNRFRVAAVDAHEAQLHVVGVVGAGVVVARNAVVAADGQAERLGDFADVDAERRGHFAIDVSQQIGLVDAQRVVDVDDARQLGDAIP